MQVADEKISVLAYADDLVLISPTQAGLQQLIIITNDWCQKWRLQVNTGKTKVMHVRKPEVCQTQYQFTYGDLTLEKVEQYRYLGFLMHENCSVIPGGDAFASSGERALGAIINKVKKNGDVGFSTYVKLYRNCVPPVTDYCSGIWGIGHNTQKKFKRIDDIQYRAQRFFLGVDKWTSLAGLDGEIPLMKAKDRRIIDGVQFYNSLLKLPISRTVVKMFKVSKEHGNGSWAFDLEKHLRELGFEQEWIDQKPINIGQLEENLLKRWINEWHKEVQKKPKLRTYKLIQQKPVVANHVTSHIPKSQRSQITRLRLGTLSIQLELDRYRGIPARIVFVNYVKAK